MNDWKSDEARVNEAARQEADVGSRRVPVRVDSVADTYLMFLRELILNHVRRVDLLGTQVVISLPDISQSVLVHSTLLAIKESEAKPAQGDTKSP